MRIEGAWKLDFHDRLAAYKATSLPLSQELARHQAERILWREPLKPPDDWGFLAQLDEKSRLPQTADVHSRASYRAYRSWYADVVHDLIPTCSSLKAFWEVRSVEDDGLWQEVCDHAGGLIAIYRRWIDEGKIRALPETFLWRVDFRTQPLTVVDYSRRFVQSLENWSDRYGRNQDYVGRPIPEA